MEAWVSRKAIRYNQWTLAGFPWRRQVAVVSGLDYAARSNALLQCCSDRYLTSRYVHVPILP